MHNADNDASETWTADGVSPSTVPTPNVAPVQPPTSATGIVAAQAARIGLTSARLWKPTPIGPTCDLCHTDAPHGGTSLCLSCGSTILTLMTIGEWEAARPADIARNTAQSQILLSYVRAMAMGGYPVTPSPSKFTASPSKSRK